MSRLFWFTEKQIDCIKPCFPKVRGVGRADDCKVLSGIVYVIRNGLQWADAPAEYGPHKTLYNRFRRWSKNGVFERIFEELAKPDAESQEVLMIDATHLKAHRTASSLKKGGNEPRLIGRTKGGMNTKLHTLCDKQGRPIRLHITEGQRSDFKGADVLLKDLPKAETLLGDKGYDSNKIRNMLADQEITPCIPPRKNREKPIEYCKTLYKTRHRIENLFAKLKDWRRIATRYDRCAHTFRSAIYLAATVIFWL